VQPDVILDLVIERQRQANWCWAAIASSLARYYGAETVDQRQVAARILGVDRSGFEAPAFDERCNVYATLRDALRAVGCYSHWSPSRPSFERICSEIEGGRPLCICIEWRTSGLHYIVVTGYHERSAELRIDDPLHGLSIHRYADFPARYRAAGAVWRNTIWTSPPSDKRSRKGADQ
jgi:hypothetical protein